MEILKYLLWAVHAIISIGLIALVAVQTNRSEGLGAVGGASSTAQRGRAGIEEQLATYTRYTAIAFMILSTLLYFLSLKFGWA
jgi:protein translocase SecG subunit